MKDDKHLEAKVYAKSKIKQGLPSEQYTAVLLAFKAGWDKRDEFK